jgi:hypothetical protein
VVILILGYFYTRTILGHVPFGRHVPRIALAATIMGGVLYLTSSLNLFVQIGLAGTVYGGALLVFRVVTIREVRMVLGFGRSSNPDSNVSER